MLKHAIWYLVSLMGIGPALAEPLRDDFQPRPFDWPQWLGAQRDNLSRETALRKSWPRKGPPLLWKAQGLGVGYSAPAVAAGRIFVMGNRGRSECVIALRAEGGKHLWSRPIGGVRSSGGGYPGPRCTPTVDGDRVYALGLNGDVVCLDTATGREHWRKNLPADYGGRPGRWGYSESPLIDGNKLICTPGGRRATLAALNKKTGRTIWRAAVPQADEAAYASVVAAEVEGRRQYVQFLSGGVVGVAADTGKFLWRYNRPANESANCATPVVSGHYLFAASGYSAGGGLARLSRHKGRTGVREVYFTRSLKNHHGGMVLVDGYLYGCNNPGSLVCLEFKTGRVMWAERRPGKGSITCADGRLYYRNEGGPVLLVEANPRRHVERGFLKPPRSSGSPAWPYPVVANGRLYLRDQQWLWCYDVKQPGSTARAKGPRPRAGANKRSGGTGR